MTLVGRVRENQAAANGLVPTRVYLGRLAALVALLVALAAVAVLLVGRPGGDYVPAQLPTPYPHPTPQGGVEGVRR